MLLQVNAAYGFNGQSNDFHSAIKLAPRQWRLVLAVNGAAENNVLIIDNDAQPVVGTIDIQAQNVGDELVTVGKKIFGEEYFQGDLAELRVFDTALSPAHLSAHLQAIKKTWDSSSSRLYRQKNNFPRNNRWRWTSSPPRSNSISSKPASVRYGDPLLRMSQRESRETSRRPSAWTHVNVRFKEAKRVYCLASQRKAS